MMYLVHLRSCATLQIMHFHFVYWCSACRLKFLEFQSMKLSTHVSENTIPNPIYPPKTILVMMQMTHLMIYNYWYAASLKPSESLLTASLELPFPSVAKQGVSRIAQVFSQSVANKGAWGRL